MYKQTIQIYRSRSDCSGLDIHDQLFHLSSPDAAQFREDKMFHFFDKIKVVNLGVPIFEIYK